MILVMKENDLLERARAYIDAGELQQALDLCLPLANGGSAEAIYLLAVVSHHGGLGEQAMDLYREAAKLLPERADVYYNFGVFLRESGQIDGATEAWMQAQKLNPNHWQASFNLGLGLSGSDRDDEAVKAYEHCLKAAPGNIDATYNLGNAHFRLGHWDDARVAFEYVLAVRPKHSAAQANLGLVLMRCGEDTRAVEICRKAVTSDPDSIVAHVNLGHALMAAGDWLTGFGELEWRWRAQTRPVSLADVADWDGGILRGGHIVLFGEQGHGDVVQFVRFAGMVRERADAGRISVMCHAPLKSLIADALGVDAVFALDEDPGEVDARAALMSLPHILWPAEGALMPVPPYIVSPEPRTFDGDGLRVGLVWRGNPEHANDTNRSCPFSALVTLFDLAGVHFYAMQWGGMTEDEIESVAGRENVTDLGRTFDDFGEAAEILAALDVLVTVDTAMAHVAGAMGVDTWVMLPLVSDWRWRGPEGFSPWYPAANFFQQMPDEDGWCGVAERLATALNIRITRA